MNGQETVQNEEIIPAEGEADRQTRAKRMLLKIAMFSIVMFFAGLTSGYIVIQSDGFWVNIELPRAFFYSTAIILMSSVSMNYAFMAAKKGVSKSVAMGSFRDHNPGDRFYDLPIQRVFRIDRKRQLPDRKH